jgi:CDP-paratose synthetase
MKAKTIIITGGTGYLGSHLLRRLLSEGHKAILLKKSSSDMARIEDISHLVEHVGLDEARLEDAFARGRVDVVLHCATDYGRGGDVSNVVETNLLFPLRLLELSKRHGASVFINTDTILDRRVSPYALSKKQFTEWLQRFADDMACVNVELETFYGPGEDPGKFITHVARSLVEEAERIDLTGGTQKRDFVYIDDVVEAYATIIRNADGLPKGFHRFGVGAGKPTTIKALVESLRKMAGNKKTRLDFGALPSRPHEPKGSVADASQTRRLGWRPKVALRDGLKKVVEYEIRRRPRT